MDCYLKKALVFLLLTVFPGTPLAQYPNIRVSQVGSTDPEEVTISINPANPLNLAAGANLNYYYYSMDDGLTWQEGRLTSSLGVWGDPSVAFDADGNLYYAHLSNPAQGDWLDRIVVQKSIDGGITWNDGVGVGLNPPKDQDKEWLAADLTDSPFRNNLYMAWTEFDNYGSPLPTCSTRILFSRSTDSGESWSSPIRVSDIVGNCRDGDNTVEGAVPAVGPNGEVYTSWAGPLGIMFDKSTDGGVTFGSDIFVTDQPGGWDFNVPDIYRCNGLPITACDISSSPYRGNIYIVWSDQRNGTDDTDVFFITSTDGGESWGDVKRVNDDTGTAHQFFPWMTVDPITGTIYTVFYDRRNSSDNETDVYVATSDDGGETFTNFKVSATPFTTVATVFFGDYINIAARDGKAYPIWTRMDDTYLSIWMARIGDVPVVCLVTLTSPNGGESLCAGESHDITWMSGYTSGNVKIEYSTNNGSNWQIVVASTADDGSHSWTIPHTPSLDCLVKVCDADNDTCCDQSDSTFTIYLPCEITLTSPNGGESWCAEESHDITWTSEYTSGNVKIEYSTNSGLSWQTITANTPDDGSYSWTIPNTPSLDCLVKVCDTDNDTCCDRSDSIFKISGCGLLTIVTDSLSEGTETCSYDDTLTASGGILPYSWSIRSGALPSGLDLDSVSGNISGEPDSMDTFCFTIEVEDDVGTTDMREYCLTIAEYTGTKGDPNWDCTINIIDALLSVNILLENVDPTPKQEWGADCNGSPNNCDGDGTVNILDTIKIVNLLLELDECP